MFPDAYTVHIYDADRVFGDQISAKTVLFQLHLIQKFEPGQCTIY